MTLGGAKTVFHDCDVTPMYGSFARGKSCITRQYCCKHVTSGAVKAGAQLTSSMTNLLSSACRSVLGIRMKVVAQRPGTDSIATDLRTSAITSLKEIANTSQARSKTAMVSFAQAATDPGSRPVQNPRMWIGYSE